MSRKSAGIIAVAVAVALCVYMLSTGGSSTPEEQGTQSAAAPAAQPTSQKPAEEMDEQAAALAEMEKEAAKMGLSKLYIVKCSACHGRDGKGPIGPSIAGKGYDYNMDALMKYKNGQVQNTMMKGLLENTSVEELEMLAKEVSSFK